MRADHPSAVCKQYFYTDEGIAAPPPVNIIFNILWERAACNLRERNSSGTSGNDRLELNPYEDDDKWVANITQASACIHMNTWVQRRHLCRNTRAIQTKLQLEEEIGYVDWSVDQSGALS